MDDLRVVQDLLTDTILGGAGIESVGENFGGWYTRPSGGVLVTRRDRELMERLVDHIRTDSVVAESANRTDVYDEVVTAVVDGTVARDAGTLDTDRLASELLARIRAGIEEWSVLWPVPGLALPEGATLRLGGLILGRLSDAQADDVRIGMEAIGRTVRRGEDGAPGSALPSIMEDTEEVLASSAYWAVGLVEGRRKAIEWIMEERVTVALDVLRVFGLYVGIDPDRTHLGEPADAATRRRGACSTTIRRGGPTAPHPSRISASPTNSMMRRCSGCAISLSSSGRRPLLRSSLPQRWSASSSSA